MKKLKELTLKEHADLKRSGLMWVVFPNATGDFREDCEEVKKVKDKCEWKDGKFEGCELTAFRIKSYGWKFVKLGEYTVIKYRDDFYDFCPFCGADIRKPEPAEPLIVKSGETWVVYWEGVDYLSFEEDIVWTSGDTTGLFLRQLKKGIWKSFTGPNPDITELTDEIAKLRSMVFGWNMVKDANDCFYKLLGVEGSGYKYIGKVYQLENCRLATYKELQEKNK